MPELPEAETIARYLHQTLAGRRLGRVISYRPDIVHGDPRPLSVLLPGRRVQCVRRRAKRVILELRVPAERRTVVRHPPLQSPLPGGTRGRRTPCGPELIFHLGMSGRLTLVPAGQPVEPHTHLRIAIADMDCELRFRDPRRFGGVWCLAGSEHHVGRKLGEVGVEPLETAATLFREILERRRQIKALLMDQRMIAGLGNIYCDEALHAAGIHPLVRANTLDVDQRRRLLRAIKSILRRAIRLNGSTFMDYRKADGSEGSFQKHHRVYRRAGKPCHNCGTPIERILAAGRSTFFCPKCQND